MKNPKQNISLKATLFSTYFHSIKHTAGDTKHQMVTVKPQKCRSLITSHFVKSVLKKCPTYSTSIFELNVFRNL